MYTTYIVQKSDKGFSDSLANDGGLRAGEAHRRGSALLCVGRKMRGVCAGAESGHGGGRGEADLDTCSMRRCRCLGRVGVCDLVGDGRDVADVPGGIEEESRGRRGHSVLIAVRVYTHVLSSYTTT